jgi:peptide deformylase
MILPIVAYGNPVLRKVSKDIDENYPLLDKLIEDMKETMKKADGVGLAANQIGKAIRLFVVDASGFAGNEKLKEEQRERLKSFKKTFINPYIIEETGEDIRFTEGCLSIPNINESVVRKNQIKMKYLNENFEPKEEVFSGIISRIIQHEYDHIEGVLFTDKVSSIKKKLLKNKLKKITDGKVNQPYLMEFYN